VSLEAYAAAFTSAFRGYQHPVTHDAVSLARRVRIEQYDLASSLLALGAGGEVAGVAALAVRGERGWCAGLAVVPERRGRGLGRALMSALLERARAAGLRQLSLEVLSVNTPARRLYESFGMRATRELLAFERAAEGAAGRRAAAPKEAPAAELLQHFSRMRTEPPAWQREPASLLASDLRGFYVGGRRRPRACALVGLGRGGITGVNGLAAEDAAQAEAMCAALGRVPGLLRIVNEPARSLFVAPLLAHGFKEFTRQHEMTMGL
jgi:ribosomal protein S18 acetylase RimI-like enzyme